jgi:hypothetical protein
MGNNKWRLGPEKILYQRTNGYNASPPVIEAARRAKEKLSRAMVNWTPYQ